MLRVHVPDQRADDVEDLVAEVLPHLVQSAQQTDQHLALAGVARGHVVDLGDTLLPVAVDAPHALLQSRRDPGQVVVDHAGAELEVDALTGSLGSDHHLGTLQKFPLGAAAVVVGHTPVYLSHPVSPLFKQIPQEIERVLEFGKHQEPLAVSRFHPGLGHDFTELNDLGLETGLPHGVELCQEHINFGCLLVPCLFCLGRGGQFSAFFGFPALVFRQVLGRSFQVLG